MAMILTAVEPGSLVDGARPKAPSAWRRRSGPTSSDDPSSLSILAIVADYLPPWNPPHASHAVLFVHLLVTAVLARNFITFHEIPNSGIKMTLTPFLSRLLWWFIQTSSWISCLRG